MIKLKLLKLLKNKRGMTLVEVVTSIAILTLLVVFVLSIFSSAVIVVGNQAEVKNSNANAAAGIENEAVGFTQSDETVSTGQSSGQFKINFGGVSINQSGTYYKSADEDSDGTYYYFEPNS